MPNIDLFPIFDRHTVYNDHYEGELHALGDALGRDCMVCSFEPNPPFFMRLYRNDGSRNEDWYSWNVNVYAPISGTIEDIYINEITNIPGEMNPSRASFILIEARDNIHVILAHIQDPVVKIGDHVLEGQLVAHVGNNGNARNPHIHIGAYINDIPCSISFHPQKEAEMRSRVNEAYWLFGNSDLPIE